MLGQSDYPLFAASAAVAEGARKPSSVLSRSEDTVLLQIRDPAPGCLLVKLG
jgi:hypothetical protein